MADIAQQTPGGSPAAAIDEAKRQKLLELVRGRALARPTDLAEDEVMVWPSLVVVEAVCATVFLLLLIAALGPVQRAADGAGQPEPDAEPVQGAVVLPEPAGAAAAHGRRAGRRDRADAGAGARSPPFPISTAAARRRHPGHVGQGPQDRRVHRRLHHRGADRDDLPRRADRPDAVRHRRLLADAARRAGVGLQHRSCRR